MNLNIKRTLLAAVTLTAGISGACAAPPENVVELNVTREKISEGFIGNGIQFGLYEHCHDKNSYWGKGFNMWMDDAMWDKTFERLDFMRPGLVRTMVSQAFFSNVGKDAEGNTRFDLDHNIGVAEKWLNYCDRNKITVLWGEWGTGKIAEITDPVWAKAVVRFAGHLIDDKGHRSIKYLTGVNEPDGGWTEATKGKYEPWRTANENLSREIREQGLSGKLSLGAPDACPGITGTKFIERTAQDFSEEPGVWNIHIYPYTEDIRNGSYERSIRQWHGILGRHKKLVIGEIGMKYKQGTPAKEENLRRAKEDPMHKSDTLGGSNMFVYDFFYGVDLADLYIQCMRGGISGACAWMLCDAMNSSPGQLMRRWGMWNIFGSKMGFPEDENIRPWFYTVSLLSRYFPAGSDILDIEGATGEGLRAVAGNLGGEITVAVVNNSDEARTVNLRINGEGKRKLRYYNYFDDDRPTDKKQLPVPKQIRKTDLSKTVTIRMPSKGFVLLTSLDY